MKKIFGYIYYFFVGLDPKLLANYYTKLDNFGYKQENVHPNY